MPFFILCLFLAIFPQNTWSKVGIGSGLSVVTEGRHHPLLYASIESDKWALTANSVGFQTSRTYHSAYQANLFYMFKPQKVLWTTFDAGIGWGAFYYKQGFKFKADSTPVERDNYATGPAIRVLWHFMGPVFLGLEAMFGIRGLQVAVLSTQDVSSLIFGVRF